ncbi:SDR family oxidoreductase [Burkholderiaceae bacterium FT117]|uniref:SDR family oxidoreductase n=1 Tax=Zeimonas sediminis TaxID=2944268 RepID=UPI002342E8F4|nr:SDR family oxidoreductase [Zeimonas sediminis]MCM5569910.1 SDR family oxidoreductase [Zeimonas sediminis]
MNKVMIVTGGSRGIGAATVVLAASHGYDVCFSYAGNTARANEVAAAGRATGRRVLAVQADMATDEGVKALFAACDAEFGPPDALVNNAGTTGPIRKVADIDADTLRAVFELNVTGYFLAAREAIRRMSTARGGKGGAIVNVSSRAAPLGGGGEWVHYAASKGATDTFTIGLSREVGAEGIRVNAVRPGLIDTELHAAAGAPDRLTRLMSGVPMGRAGSAEEVAETILWLAGPQSSYVSGALVDVSGAR